MKHSPKEYILDHLSFAFLAVLTCISMAGLALSAWLGESESGPIRTAMVIVSHLSAAILAACTLGVFFALRDMRDSLISSINMLMFDAGIVRHMSKDSMAKLAQEITQENLSAKVQKVDQDLYDYLCEVRDYSLSQPIMRNYHESITMTMHPSIPNTIMYSTVRAHELDASHLQDQVVRTPFRFSFALANPGDAEVETFRQSIKFECKIGKRGFGPSDLLLTKGLNGSYPMIVASLETHITIHGCIDVKMSFQSEEPYFDNTEVVYARWPCRGFSVDMHFLTDYQYDFAWFVQWLDSGVALPGSGQSQTDRSGISVSTNNWLLPGDGVVLSWYESIANSQSDKD